MYGRLGDLSAEVWLLGAAPGLVNLFSLMVFFFCCRSLHLCSKNQNPDHLSIRGNKSFVLEQE